MGLALLLAAGALIALATLVAWTASRLARPPRRTFGSAVAAGRPREPADLLHSDGSRREFATWTLETAGLRLPVWDFPGNNVAGPVLVLTHGWGDSRIGALTRADALLPHVCRVVAWDMPGHGDAPGSSTLGWREPAMLRELAGRIGGTTPVILMGWSLGAGVSIAAAADNPPPGVAGVIAEAPYRLPITPASAVMAHFGMPRRVNLPLALGLVGLRVGAGWGWRNFDRAALAARARVPLLVVHGGRDGICPVADGREIARRAPNARLVTITDAGHHGLWSQEPFRGAAIAAVAEWLATLQPAPLTLAAT
ncbi:MAG TPA: alpha/beta fold hydrolase [Phycisphaerales bacterium]|nr:alpha/beta fold hydrolase [Phycisphaerales bacterium]